MQKTILSLSFMLASIGAFSQQIERCYSHKAIEYQNQLTPGYAEHVNNVFENAKAYAASNQLKAGEEYTIPVVVHVVYNTPEQNIADSVVLNQIQILNDDYNRRNADTVNMRSDFDIVAGSPKIKFVLAQIDASGNATTGITRTNTSTETFGGLGIITGDMSSMEAVKSTADGGIDPWDQSRYMNIWVCNMSLSFGGQDFPALLGYATPPDGLTNWPAGSTGGLGDGVVIQYQAFGSNNPNELDMGQGPIEVLGRTPIHEVGHYLGLRHIWGDGDCNEHDGIDDTPNADAESNFDCDDTKNTCVDNIQGVDLPDMIENFMDYSAESCQNSFTQGQVDLMHAVLDNERFDLVNNNPASIDEVNIVDLNIYPNPTKSSFTLTFNANVNNIELVNLYGTVVKDLSLTSGSSYSVDGLAKGVYFVKCTSNEGIAFSKKLIIQ